MIWWEAPFYGGGIWGMGSHLTARAWSKNLERVLLPVWLRTSPGGGHLAAGAILSSTPWPQHPLLPFCFYSASPETPTGSPQRSQRPSADIQAASTPRGRKTAPWTPLPSIKKSWSSGGSPRAVLIPSGWRRCGSRLAAPVSLPSCTARPDQAPQPQTQLKKLRKCLSLPSALLEAWSLSLPAS